MSPEGVKTKNPPISGNFNSCIMGETQRLSKQISGGIKTVAHRR